MTMGVPQFERFFRVAGSLDVDKQDLKRFDDFVNHKLYDLSVIEEATAKANGWDIIEPRDLPITKGLQESMHQFRQLAEDTEQRLPAIAGGLSVALRIIDPNLVNPHGEQWERALRVFDLLP